MRTREHVLVLRVGLAAALAALAVALPACTSKQRAAHDALATSLREPVRKLCRGDTKEGGGCNGDCLTWNAAADARDALEAAEALERLQIDAAAGLGPELDAVRASSRAVLAKLSAACPEHVERFGPLTPGVSACAARGRDAAVELRALREAVTALDAGAERASGASLLGKRAACR